MNGASDIVDDIIGGQLRAQAITDLRIYFASFTGRRFERFDSGGDRSGVANVITSADLIAVSTLSIRWDAQPALELLERRSTELTALLAAVPHDPIHEVADDVLDIGSEADRAWRILVDIRGIGRTIAGKVLARKRPHLIPIYDTVLGGLLGNPRNVWSWWHEWFQVDSSRVQQVVGLREEAGGIDDISLLRCLDVALRMHGTQRGVHAPETELAAP